MIEFKSNFEKTADSKMFVSLRFCLEINVQRFEKFAEFVVESHYHRQKFLIARVQSIIAFEFHFDVKFLLLRF